MKILSKLDSLDNIQDGNTRKLITKTTSSGSGNAVTAVSVSGDTITYTKGSTFLTGHQSAFSNVKVGSSTVAADQAGDTLELVAGDNITLTPDTTNDKVTIAAAFATKLTGTQANPIYLTSLSGGQYLIKGYIKLDSNTNFILEEGSAFDVQDIPNYILFEIKEVNNVKFVSCDYGHWIIEYTGSIWRIEQGSEFVDWDNLNYITDEVLPETYYSISNPNGYTSNTGTITGITMNGASKGTSGVVDLGTVLTSHQSIKTINNNTITGTGNVSVGTITKVQANGTDVASSGTANIPAASTSAYGVTKLSNATDSTSEVLAATPKAVKAAYDLAAGKGTGTITGVSVNGTSVATSGVANITSVPASILSGAIANGVTATTQSSGDNSTKVATTAYVDGAITALPEPMIFKGSLGTGGTITSLPTAAASNEGFTYKVITAGTYASQAAKVGDTFISDGSAWVLIPSGDEPSGTVTSITLNAISPISIDNSTAITSSGTRTLSHANSGVTAGTYKSVTVNATGHITGGTNPTTISGYGITDAKIASGVITLGSNTITPLTASSTLDATKVSGTLPTSTYTDTKNTAGSTDSSKKLFLVGAESQAANPQTYSQDTAYVGTDGHLYSNSKQTVNLSDTQALTNKTYNGYTLGAACAKAVVTSVDTSASLPTSNAVKTFVEGKGYTTNTGTITGVSVNGTSVATSGVANITSVPASILSGAIANGVTATTQSSGDNSTKVATTAYVDAKPTILSGTSDPASSLGKNGDIYIKYTA